MQATPHMRWHCVLCIAVRCACGAICARSLTSKLADVLRLIIELCEFAPPTQNEKGMLYGIPFLFWSKWRDSNSRPPVPEAILSSLLTTFVCFLVLFSPKTMLSDALVRTVSTQSKSVDGQRCGHRANSANLKARK